MKQSQRAISKALTDQRGVTGLETAIILIAFVVVASVFAFTVLSTGIFSSERGKETVFAGLREARGTVEPKGSVIANGYTKDTLSLANAAWTKGSGEGMGADVTSTVETTDKKEGTGSEEILLGANATTGLAAFEDLAAAADLSDQTQVSFWIKSTTSTTAGQVEIVLDEAAGCGDPEAHIDVPVLSANTWLLVTAAITQSDGTSAVTNANKDAIACVGVEIETAFTGNDITINVDEVIAVGHVSTVLLSVTNAVEGEPVDLTEPSDSDNDGIADSDGNHVMVITYTDKNQLVRDVYWTKVFLGENDADDLLESGERTEITVDLSGLAAATPLVKDLEFSLEVKPAVGAVLVIKRRTPAVIDTVMNLN